MSVVIADVEPERVSTSWQKSKQSLLLYDLAHQGLICAEMPMRCGTDGLVGARNEVVCQFLERDEEWLFWVDTDMGFAPDTVERLHAAADKDERPIVGGLCFIFKELGQDGMGGFDAAPRPTIFDWALVGPEQHGFTPRLWYPPSAVVQCGATGSACILIHRSVFEKIEKESGPNWYTKVRNPETGKLMSEDISLCVRAASVGCPVHVHTGVRTTHHKDVWVGEGLYWKMLPAPPATKATAVIVPVLGRPQNAAPFMESLLASTGMANVYAIAHTDDVETVKAWEATTAEVITGPSVTFPEKVNVGYDITDEPWLFLAGDDVRFHPGWLDHAQAMGDAHNVAVVGTNDLCNPAVVAGEHGTHLLIRRSYIDEVGASWDGPGTVCHEGYRHNYVDNEIVAAAKQRNQWISAPGSVVEHLHPVWGTAPSDETYEIGNRTTETDRKHYLQRLKRNRHVA